MFANRQEQMPEDLTAEEQWFYRVQQGPYTLEQLRIVANRGPAKGHIGIQSSRKLDYR